MNYCTKCGTKLTKDTKFCSKCGTPTKKTIEEKKIVTKEKKEVNKEKLLLSIGTLLVIVASVIFAFANWNEMSSMFKILFLLIESLLFLSLSLFSKRVDYKMPYKALWFIGITFIPIILNLVAVDAMLGEYLSYNGNGIYVYLAISSVICGLIYFISDRVLKSNVFVYSTYIFVYIFISSVCGIFKLQEPQILMPILSVFSLLVCIFHSFIKNDNYRKTINIFISIITTIIFVLSIIYIEEYSYGKILVSILAVSNIASQILLMFKRIDSVAVYIYPFTMYAILLSGIDYVFRSYPNIILFISVLACILISFIMNLCSSRVIKNISFIVMLNYVLLVIGISGANNLTLAIVSIMTILTFLFTIRLDIDKIQTNISKFLLPLNLLVIIYNTIRVFVNMDASIIYIIASVVCFTVYVLLQQKSKDTFAKTIFEVFSYAFLIISSLIIFVTKPTEVAFVLNEVVWLYYFIFSSAIKENKGVNISLLVGVILNFIFSSIRYSISLHYSLIFISVITIILDIVEQRFNNKKSSYIYISIVAASIATLSDFANLSIFGLGLNVLTFAASYLILNKYHKPSFIIKFLYTVVGFVLIDSVFNYFISDLALSNLFILISYIIIIISMFLLEVDADEKVLCYSFVTVYPYLKLVYNVDFLGDYTIPLIVLLSLIMILIYFERVFKLKEKDKIIIELILLGFIHLVTIADMLVFDFVLSAFYIFYGFYKKRDSYVLFGAILLITTLVINIFTIVENITVTYVLLVIGLIMLGYVFYLEAKKNNKK